ncbi:MAG: VWA domain-containing protein [Dichotomicrobium sp.]
MWSDMANKNAPEKWGTDLPVSSDDKTNTPAKSSADEIDAFVAQVRDMPAPTSRRGRLIFAMDATMSRQPAWDLALRLQAEMFDAVAEIGGLDVQLIYFRGFEECRASKWVSDAHALKRLMTGVACRGGFTQIRKVLKHARAEADGGAVSALVYVGDCMEENVDELADTAGQLGLMNVPAFMFQEGDNPVAATAFKEIARLTGGAYCRFDAGAADSLRALLQAVAVYAAGGRKALENLGGPGGAGQMLLEQLKS